MTNLNKIRQFSAQDRRLLFQAVLLLPVVHLALLLLGYYRLRKAMEKRIPSKALVSPEFETRSLQRAREIARIVGIAARYGFYRATCLRRSLLLWWFLHRDGIPGTVCFGVRRVAGQLEAHAWVEYQGEVVNDSPSVAVNYRALYEVLPATSVGL